ncbi:MAG: carbohydrate binding family 9 domain-containing protein [Cyclobacteriaceae bacterium]|nr:carbohydrate binding family 9 domain-containing protein [Cyclobacteriaceae bacterium]MCH8517539.1 carbohydrate binding family 9 domain-containing protein [Cyclobacteriaceae bacterium]
MRNKYFRIFLFFFLLPYCLHAQMHLLDPLNANYSLEEVFLDGKLDEDRWQNVDPASNFYQNFPSDTSYALSKTEVMVSFDDQFIYIAAKCYDEFKKDKYIISSLRRDFGGSSDMFEVYIDPFGDGLNGFAFGVNPLGVKREGLISNGANLDLTWDNRWKAEVAQTEYGWSVEMAIPLKTLRYEEGSRNWRMNFARVDLKRNETSTWAPVSRAYRITTLAFTGQVVFEKGIGKDPFNVVAIPYVTGQAERNLVGETSQDIGYNFGGDAKVAVSSALNLDLTFNPDFSQVEVDRQVTNLSRFEIFFPERRQFFIENSDLFSSFGFSRIRPFFSRRIGVGTDPFTRQFRQTPIIYGARLSGRLDRNWRIGAMNIQTNAVPEFGITGENYSVAAVQRRVGKRNNVGAILVNKQVNIDADGSVNFQSGNFNRVAGLDFNLASANNRWRGKYFIHNNFRSDGLGDSFAHASYTAYDTKKWYLEWNHEYVGENYNPEVGFVPRRGHWRLEQRYRYWMYPKSGKVINRHGPMLDVDFYLDVLMEQLLDGFTFVGYQAEFQDLSYANVFMRSEYIYLFDSFDPSNTGGERLPQGSDYFYNVAGVNYNSDARKLLSFSTSVSGGSYFNGNIFSFSQNLNYRWQPFGFLGIAYDFNRLKFPEPYTSTDLHLIGPSIDWSFSKSVFLRAVVQYNNQIDNINSNIRFQWRFAPVSDLFIVYTDNYAGDFTMRNQGVVLKLTYWGAM